MAIELTALAIELTAVFSPNLFSESFDFQQPFELGKYYAKERKFFWGWYFLGIGSVYLAKGALFAIEDWRTEMWRRGDIQAVDLTLFYSGRD